MSKTIKSKTLPSPKDYVSIGVAARDLGVSLDTVRRWEKAGELKAHRLDGKNRYFAISDLHAFKTIKPLTTAKVAQVMNVSQSTVRRLELKGLLVPERNEHGKRLYSPLSVSEYVTQHEKAPSTVQPFTSSLNAPSNFEQIEIDPVTPVPVMLPRQKTPSTDRKDENPVVDTMAMGSYALKKPADNLFRGYIAFGSMIVLIIIMLLVSPWNSSLDNSKTALSDSQLAENRSSTGLYNLEPLYSAKINNTPGLSLSSTFFVNLPGSGLTVSIPNRSISGNAASEDRFATLPVSGAQIADGAIGASQLAQASVGYANLSPELQAQIGSNGLVRVSSPSVSSTVYNTFPTYNYTNVQQVNGTTIATGTGLISNLNNNTQTLSIAIGTSTQVLNNKLEVRLSTGDITNTVSSASGLEESTSGIQLLGGCTSGQVLAYSGSAWNCSTVSSASSNLAIQSGGTTVTAKATAVNFATNDFTVTDNAGQATVAINYANSKLTRSTSNEAIAGNWTFKDSGFVLTNAADATKSVSFDTSGIAPNTNRTLSIPDVSGVIITTGNLADITSLGTITSGTWQGSTLGVQYGGTGATSFLSKGIIYGNGSGALQASLAGTAGQLLQADSGGVPTFKSLSGDATLSASGILALANTTVVANSYGDATHVPVFTVDAKGRITGVASTLITGAAATGAAGGDLTGSYPNPTIAKLQGTTLTTGALATGNILIYNGSAWVNQSLAGDITVTGNGVATIANGAVTNARLSNSSLTVIAGSGLNGGGAVSLGGTTTLTVAYGAGASTAAEGNSPLSFTGTGNLTGVISGTTGGNFTTNSLDVVTNPTFTTSVTTPVLNATSAVQTAGVARISSTGSLQNVTATTADGVSFDANTITSGTLSDSRLSVNVTVQGNTFNGSNQLVQLTAAGKLPALDGSALTAIAAGNISGILGVTNGGTGATALTNHGIIYGQGTATVGVSAAGTAGQLLQAGTGGTPVFNTLSGDASLATGGALTLSNTSVVANTYGDATHVGQFTVDSKGRVINASSVIITGAAPTGSASGDLTGNFPSPTIASLQSNTLTLASLTSGQILISNGSAIVNQSLSGDITLGGTGAATIVNGAVSNAKLTNSSLTVTAGSGLSGGGLVALGSSTSLSVNYGSTAATAAQGNTSLSFTGTGNLTGSLTGTAGGGFTTTSLAVVNNPTFTTSVTTPIVSNAGNLNISATGAAKNIILSATGNIQLSGFNCSTYNNGGTLTTDVSGYLTCKNDVGGTAGSITGSGTVGTIPIYNGTGSLGDSPLALVGTSIQLAAGNNLALLGGDISVSGNQSVSGDVNIGGSIKTASTVRLDAAGLLQNVSATAASGVSFDANTIASGTLSDIRLSTNVTMQGNTFNGNSQLIQTTAAGKYPALDGSLITGIIASSAASLTGTVTNANFNNATTYSNITAVGTLTSLALSGAISGATTVDGATLSGGSLSATTVNGVTTANITTQGNTFNGNSQLVQTTAGGKYPALDGSLITSVNAANLGGQAASYYNNAANLTGSVADARLSTNVTLAGNTFNGSSQLVQTTAGGLLPVLNGSNLTNVAAATAVNATSLTGTITNANINSGTTYSNITAVGTLTSLALSGAIIGATTINGATISGGSLSATTVNGIATATITTAGNTFNGSSQLLQLTAAGKYPALDGSLITGIVATSANTATTANSLTGVGVITNANLNNAAAYTNITTVGTLGSLAVSGTITGGTYNGATIASTSFNGLSINASNLTAPAGLTIASGGASDLGLTSASGNIALGAVSFTTANTGEAFDLKGANANVLTLKNTGTGTADLNLNNGGLQIAGSTVITSGKVLQNVSIAASQLTGAISAASLTASSVTTAGNTFNGNSQLIQTTAAGKYPALDGSLITGIIASSAASLTGTVTNANFNNATTYSNITAVGTLSSLALSGAITGATTVDGATLSGGSLSATTVNGVNTANITTAGNTFNGNSQLVQTTAGGALPVLSGANLTNLSAAQVSGTLSSVTLASPTVTTTITGSGSPTLTGFGAITAGTFNGLTIGANALSVIGAGGLTITPGAGGITLANLAGVGIVHTDATGKLTTSALTNTDLSGTSVNIAAGTNLTGGNASLSPGGTATLNLNPTLTGITGITFTSGSLALNNGGIAAAGSIAGVTTISSNNTYTNTLASGTAINASGTPAANGTFVQLGNALSGGSASGTYIGTNQVGTADFFNFQKSGVSQLKLSSVGALTNAGGLTILSNGLSATGNSSITGTLSGLTGLAGSGTTAFSGPTSVTSTFTVNTGTGDQVSVNSGASAPTVDQVAIDNTGSSGVITNGVNSVNVHYKGGAAAVEGSGMRVDYTPGTTSGGTWSGVRIAEATPSAAGVNSYGVKLEGGGAGSGTSIAVEVASGWDIGVDVQSGGLQLAAQADPAAPTAGNLRIYAKDIAGKILPKFVGPSGVDTPFQASLGFNRIAFSEPTGTANCSTGAVGFGSTSTGAGTCVVPNISSANLLSSVRRETYSSGTTAGTVSYQRQSQLQVWRGNAPSLGGFFYTTRFGTSTTVAGNRAFVGLSSSIATPTNIDPTTSATIGRVGLVTNANTGDWSIATNAVGAAPSLINLGANFPIDNTSMYELVLFSAPNGTSIGYRVTNSSTGSVSSGTLSANLPTNTTFLAPQFWITNNATAAAATIDFAGWYLESDN